MNDAQACLVPILGKMSGREVDKRRLCGEAGHKWATHRLAGAMDMELLQDCVAYLRLRPLSWQVGRCLHA